MAKFIANATGNWSATGTWAAVRNTESIHATTNITVTSGGITSATFTAPDTTSSVTGVLIYISGVGTAGTLVATLQEATVDTVATVSVSITSLKTGGWVYLKLATPYVYTATTAGRYRWKLNTSGASGTTSVGANSGGTNFAYASGDNLVAAVPTTNDDVYIAGNNLSALVVTVDDTSRLVGSGTGTGAPLPRNTTAAINLSNGGALGWSTTANSTLECKGQIEVAVDGEVQMGTVATPIPSSYIAKLITNQNGTDVNYDLLVEASGKWKMQGASRTFWKTTFVSGLGTAASPLVTADAVDWNVGDEFVITGQGAYNHYEKRFIITKNSSTSYVVSSTAGGAETALVNAHDSDDRIVLLTRNVIITSKVTTEGWCFTNKATTSGYVDCDWSRVEYTGGTVAARRGFQVTTNGTSQVGGFDYSVVYLPEFYGLSWTTTTVPVTVSGVIVYGQSGASNVGAFIASGAKNIIFEDCFTIGNYAAGFQNSTVGNLTFNRCEAWNNNQGNVASGGINLTSAFSCTFNDFVCQANRIRGIYINGTTKIQFTNAMIGNYGSNAIDVDAISDTYNEVLFLSPTFGSATTVNNYLNMVPGSEIKIDKFNTTENRHLWYTAYGVNYATGASLPDTTTVYTDHLSVRLSPEDSTVGCSWEFQVLARPGYFVSAQGLAQKNVAFGTDDLIVDLYLPDSTTPDATFTMPDDTNVNVFNIGAVYSGSIPRLATVRITAKSATASAYAYVGRLFNGTNSITALDTWHEGKPSQIMYPELGDPDAVWAVSTSGLTTSGTTGKKLVSDLTLGQFIGLK